MKRQIGSAGRALLASISLGVLANCGGGSPSSPTIAAVPTPTPAPAPQVLLQGTSPLQAGFYALTRSVTVTSSGVLEFTVDWTFLRNNVEIALLKGECTNALLEAEQCPFLSATNSTTAKPEKVRINVTAGVYSGIIVNFGAEDESVAAQLVFIPGATVASASSSKTFSSPLPTKHIDFP